MEAPAQENVDEQIDAEKEKISEDEKTGGSEADKRVMNILISRLLYYIHWARKSIPRNY